MSSENIDINCSSSSRSNPWLPAGTMAAEFRNSSRNVVSRNATESLADRRWAPRRADEKSRNSSTDDGNWLFWAVAVAVKVPLVDVGPGFAIVGDGILWWGIKGGQFWVIVGILGGNCAIGLCDSKNCKSCGATYKKCLIIYLLSVCEKSGKKKANIPNNRRTQTATAKS